jgi:DNA polymerase I
MRSCTRTHAILLLVATPGARPLLVVDGDSFTHRAYHALPKTMRREDGGPANALIGFTDMLLRLWRAEQPRAVLVGWDTLEVPTYRHEALEGYQSGREFDDALLEQLHLLPELVESAGFVSGKAPGYEADDFLAAAATREEAAGGVALVATSDRDAFQLVTEHVIVLQPAKGGPARIGPAEVRERYGVDPRQVTDFIALRGDPSDRIPGARGIGPKRGAELLAQYGSLDAMLHAGRFATEADALLLYRRIATMDREAPLRDLPDVRPDWTAAAAYARQLGVPQVALRFEEALASR